MVNIDFKNPIIISVISLFVCFCVVYCLLKKNKPTYIQDSQLLVDDTKLIVYSLLYSFVLALIIFLLFLPKEQKKIETTSAKIYPYLRFNRQ